MASRSVTEVFNSIQDYEMLEIFLISDAVYLRVDLHGQEKPEAGMRVHGMELLFQLHQPSGGQVDVLQHHPPAGPK